MNLNGGQTKMSTLYRRESNPYWHWSSSYKGRRLRKSTGMRQKHLAIQVQSTWDMMQFKHDLSFIESESMLNSSIDAFIDEYLKIRSRISRNTGNTARAVTSKFKNYLDSKGISNLRDITLLVLDGYIDYLDCSPKTKKNHMIELKKMFDRAVIEGLIPSNLVQHVTLPQMVKGNVHRMLNMADLRCIMDSAGAWKLYYEFLFRTGLRAGDVAKLTYGNIDRKRKAIISLVRKSRRIHELPLSDILIDMIGQGDIDDPLFPTLYSDSERTLNDNLKKPREYMQEILKVNGKAKATLHSFRTTFNNTLRDLGLDVTDRQILLTHASSETTKIYTHPNLDLAREWVNKIPVFN